MVAIPHTFNGNDLQKHLRHFLQFKFALFYFLDRIRLQDRVLNVDLLQRKPGEAREIEALSQSFVPNLLSFFLDKLLSQVKLHLEVLAHDLLVLIVDHAPAVIFKVWNDFRSRC